jgi:hypothetical protein
MKASLRNVKSNLLKLWSPGVGSGHNKGNYVFLWERFKKNILNIKVLSQDSSNFHGSFLMWCRIEILKHGSRGGAVGATIGKAIFMPPP